MTTGPGPGHFEAVAVPAHPGEEMYVPGGFTSYRTLDPIRACALQAAAVLCAPDTDSTTEEVLTIASAFAVWLDSKEDDGES